MENIKINNWKEGIGEARLVWKEAGGSESPAAAPMPVPETGPTSLQAGIQEHMQREVVAAIGEPLDYAALRENPDSLGDAIKKLSVAFEKLGKSFDELAAIFAPLGVKPSEIEYSLQTPDAAAEKPSSADTAQAEAEIAQKGKEAKTSAGALSRVKLAERKLKEHPEWMEYIHQASAKYNIPVSTIVAFITMESGWNPRAHNASSASGFAQVITGTLNTYKRSTGNPSADPYDPKTSIDIAAWVCRDIINSVNQTVDRQGTQQGFKQEYKIGLSDIRKLYLSYNNGPWGYLVLQRYVDNPTPENFGKMTWWQRRTRDGWQDRYNYSGQVEAVALAYAARNPDAPTALA